MVKKDVLRTIRIPQSLDLLIQTDADINSVSINTLVTQILTKYAEWDRYVVKMGWVSLAPQLLRGILNAIDRNKFSRSMDRLGAEYLKEWLMFRFGKISADSWRESGLLVAKYQKSWGELQTNAEGSMYHFNYSQSYYHNLGKMWSFVLAETTMSAIKLFKLPNPKIETTANSLILIY